MQLWLEFHEIGNDKLIAVNMNRVLYFCPAYNDPKSTVLSMGGDDPASSCIVQVVESYLEVHAALKGAVGRAGVLV